MSQVINLGPVLAAQRITKQLLSRCGLDFFTIDEEEGPAFRIDSTKLDWVVEMAKREALRQAPWLDPSEFDLELCKKMLRRDVIYKIAVGLVDSCN